MDCFVTLLSHSDLDGVVGAMISKYAADILLTKKATTVVRFCSLRNSEDIFRNLSALRAPFGVIDMYIDPDPLREGIEAREEILATSPHFKNIPLLLDHHKESEKYSRNSPICVVDNSVSASMLALNHYQSLGVAFPEALLEYATLANDYDLWIHEYPESNILNAMVSVYGADGAFQALTMGAKQGMWKTDSLVKAWVKRHEERVERAINDMRFRTYADHSLSATCAFLYPRESFDVSDVNASADAVIASGKADICVYLFPASKTRDAFMQGEKRRISLRSSNGRALDLLYKMSGMIGAKGGGHPNACGCTLPPRIKNDDDVAEAVFQSFEKMYSEISMESVVISNDFSFGV